MELLLQADSISASEMKNAHNTMLEVFKGLINLENYYGPVQMDVWGLEYSYLLEKYKICIECERGFITIVVNNDMDERFYPSLIYSEADYYHFADKEEDVRQLIDLVYKAIIEKEIIFFSNEAIIRHNKSKMVDSHRKR